MISRRSLSPMKRLAVFEKAGGVCHLCSQRIQVGQPWEVEHVRPLGLLGADDESNMAPAHVHCHAEKTRGDRQRMTKALRQRAKFTGAKKPRSTMPGSRGSRWKRKMNGEVVLR